VLVDAVPDEQLAHALPFVQDTTAASSGTG
jgi:hypothetical protein